ncbi:MAG: O-antigen ligase family protein [Hyphomicrobiaceae bacterium]
MLIWALTAAVLTWSIATGGGTAVGFTVDALGQLFAIPLLVVAVWSWWVARRRVEFDGGGQGVGALLPVPILLVALLVGLQVLPAPFQIPREGLGPTDIAGLSSSSTVPAGWPTVSVVPVATIAAGLSLLAPLAVFIAVGCLDKAPRRSLAVLVIALGLLSLALGLLQVAQGDGSRLRFYPYTNTTEAVGLFANRNHFSAQLYVVLMLGGAWLADGVGRAARSLRRGRQAPLELAGYAAFVFALLAAVALSRSRAGMALAIVAVAAIALMARAANRSSGQGAGQQGRGGGLAVIILLGSASLFALQFGMQRIFSRFEAALAEDLRWPLLEATVSSFWNSLPFGTGLGSFVPVYASVESAAHVFKGYGNRAHNDLAEVLLESGLVGAALLALFLGWFLIRAFRIWSRPIGDDRVDDLLQRAATVVIALLLLHSLLDYPLRTTSNAVMLAFACALLLPAPAAPVRAARPRPAAARRRSDPSPRLQPVMPPSPAQPWKGNVEWPEAWRGESKDGER